MLTLVLAAAGALIAVVAMLQVAAVSRRFKALSQSHWELRFEFARLRARVAKLDGGPSGDSETDASTPARTDA
jgi:uncharacterized membrane protein YjgN (DUF898 family)